jgi:putative sporulation protein YtaF
MLSRMLWLGAVLIAVASNLDNLTVGIALGMRPLRVSALANLLIAAVTVAGTAAAMAAGDTLKSYLPESTAHLLGGLTLIAIGAWMIVTGIRALLRWTVNPPRQARDGRFVVLHIPLGAVGDRNRSRTLTPREALGLGAALALNNVASGVPAGASGIPPILVTGLTGALSLACVGGGARLGSALAKAVSGRYAPALAGVMMLAVGALAVTV